MGGLTTVVLCMLVGMLDIVPPGGNAIHIVCPELLDPSGRILPGASDRVVRNF